MHHETFNQERYLSLKSQESSASFNDYNRDELQQLEYLRPWTVDEQYEISLSYAKKLQPNLVEDKAWLDNFLPLVWYFTNDPRFEANGHGSLNKGLILTGNLGVGKSTLMKCFVVNKKACYKVVNVDTVVFRFQVGGVAGVERTDDLGIREYYSIGYAKTSEKAKYQNQGYIGACFDDLGIEESPAYHYGNKMNVFEKIICLRYESGMKNCYTHFTTNLDASEIEKRYGSRVRSRLREMCNFIEVKGGDRRK